MRSAIVLAGVLLAALVARAETARELVQKGNAEYAAGRYAEALKLYEQAQSAAAAEPGGAPLEVLHNQAAAQFRLGRIDEARELWTRIKMLGDARHEARTRYNLGNCDYAEALAAAGQGAGSAAPDTSAALEKLVSAVEQYRTALRLDPTLADARANLELAHQLRRVIEQQQSEQQSCSQPSTQPDKNSPQSQPSSQPRDQQQGEQQKSEQQESEQPESQPQQPDSQPRQPETQPSDQQPHDEPQPGEEEQQQSEPEAQAREGEEPEPDPNAPQTQPAPQPEPVTTQPAGENEQQPPPLHLTPAQAERLLQMVRDAEKARREMLARKRAAKQKPVERDW